MQYDKTAAQQPLRSLFPEDRIRVFNPASGTWTPGIVQHVAETPRSYLVATEKGGTLRENRCHLCATGESFQVQVLVQFFLLDVVTSNKFHRQFRLQLIRRRSRDSFCSRQLTPRQVYRQPRCSETDLPVTFSRRTNGRKIFVFGLWLATLLGKTDAPRFPPSLSSYPARLVTDPLSFQIVHHAMSNLDIRYCLSFSEKRTVPPFGL